MNKPSYYILTISNCEINQDGPFDSGEKRDEAAKKIWSEIKALPDGLVFQAQIEDGKLTVGTYMSDSLDSEE